MKKVRSSKTTGDQFIVRLPRGMRARIELIAAEAGRSMNSQIVMWIEKGMEHTDDIDVLFKSLAQLEEAVRELQESVFPERSVDLK